MTQTAFGDLDLVEAESWQRLRSKPLASESPGSLSLACRISGLTPWRGLTHPALWFLQREFALMETRLSVGCALVRADI